MSRTFDSLQMALRAFFLSNLWENEEHTRRTRNSALVSMPREMRERMNRAADYLYRRALRSQG